jgi:hypothetical protein
MAALARKTRASTCFGIASSQDFKLPRAERVRLRSTPLVTIFIALTLLVPLDLSSSSFLPIDSPPQLPRHRPPPPLSRSRRLGTDPRGLPYTPPSQLEKAGGGIGGPALPGPLPSGRVAIPAVGCGGARRDVRIGAWT